MTEPRVELVIPCYNEERRLRPEVFQTFLRQQPNIAFTFVNDGSTDRTEEILHSLQAENPMAVRVLDSPANGGKAEAVRLGVLDALARAPDFFGYWDADLATPLDELPVFIALMRDHPRCEMVLGARVKLMGRNIVRRSLRHYLGRCFATAASLVLDLPVYDTQCGAKLFRNTLLWPLVFAEPFKTQWIFDVEILSRFLMKRRNQPAPFAPDLIVEHPLHTWTDIGGSKVGKRDFLRAFFGLLWIGWSMRTSNS